MLKSNLFTCREGTDRRSIRVVNLIFFFFFLSSPIKFILFDFTGKPRIKLGKIWLDLIFFFFFFKVFDVKTKVFLILKKKSLTYYYVNNVLLLFVFSSTGKGIIDLINSAGKIISYIYHPFVKLVCVELENETK